MIEDWKTSTVSDYSSSGYGYLGAILSAEILLEVNSRRKSIGLRSIELRKILIEYQKMTEIDFYLPGKPWQKEKIEVVD